MNILLDGSLSKNMHLRLIILTYFSCISAYASVNPEIKWYTLRTEHFNIHYHEGDKSVAIKLANIAEKIHVRLAFTFNWNPNSPTEVVLNDNRDYSNGYATFFPFNKIYLYNFPPLHPSTFTVDYEHYLSFIFLHEYCHVLHLDRAHSLSYLLRNLFGRVLPAFPNALQPKWVTEGLATWIETDSIVKVGRGQSSTFEMAMRMEVNRGLKSLSEINLDTFSKWPLDAHYLYGYYFFQFIETVYGKEKIHQLISNYSKRVFPFQINDASRKVFNKSLNELWKEYQNYLINLFQNQINKIKKSTVHEGILLTHSGGKLGTVKVLNNGNVYFSTHSLYEPQALWLHSPSGEKNKLLTFKNDFSIHFDVHSKSGIIMTKMDHFKIYQLYSDLYLFNPATKQLKKLSKGKRYHSVTWHPSGKFFAATQYNNNRWHIHLISLSGEILETICCSSDEDIISSINWSPNGNFIVAAIHSPETRWRISEYNLKQKKWKILINNYSILTDPKYSTDGKSVLFTSDINGIYNIFKINILNKKIIQLTNTLGGAFKPTYGKNENEIYYYQYSENGYDLSYINLKQNRKKISSVNKPNIKPSLNRQDSKSFLSNYTIKKYSPFDTLTPKWWAPYVDTGNIQYLHVITSGNDALNIHHYFAKFGFNYKTNSFIPEIRYVFGKKFSAGITAVLGNSSRLKKFWMDYSFPIIYKLHKKLFAIPYIAFLNGGQNIGLSVVFKNTFYTLNAISPSYGREIQLVSEHYQTSSKYKFGQTVSFEWNEFIPLSNQHVLNIKFLHAWTNKRKPLLLGGYFQDDLEFEKCLYSLRGYPNALVKGKIIQILHAEWRFPLVQVNSGLSYLPFGLKQISGAIFAEVGNAWNKTFLPTSYLSSIGFELYAHSVVGFHLPIRLGIGYAKGLNKFGKHDIQLFMGYQFGF